MLNFGGESFFGNERNKLPFDLHQPSQNHQDHPKPNNFGFKTKDGKCRDRNPGGFTPYPRQPNCYHPSCNVCKSSAFLRGDPQFHQDFFGPSNLYAVQGWGGFSRKGNVIHISWGKTIPVKGDDVYNNPTSVNPTNSAKCGCGIWRAVCAF